MAESTRTVNRWTPTRKAAVILDLLRGGDVVELARTHGLSQAQLFAWRDRFLEAGHAALRTRQGRAAQERDLPLLADAWFAKNARYTILTATKPQVRRLKQVGFALARMGRSEDNSTMVCISKSRLPRSFWQRLVPFG
jgi:transposase-like protein